MNKKELLLLIFSLILIALLNYLPHISYSLPYHLDEWDHIGRSIRIQEQGFSYFINNTPIEIGFDLILLTITKFISLFNLDIINIYQFLPTINTLIISLILFFNLKKEYNYLLGFLPFLFILNLPSNVNILGIWFYVPILAGIPFIYIILFQIEKNIYNKNRIWTITLALICLGFIHQSSFLLISLVLTIYLCLNRNKISLKSEKILPLTIILIPIILTTLYLTNNFSNITNLFESMIWGPIQPQINYNIFSLYGWLGSVFSIIGFYISTKYKKLLTFRIYYSISLISIILFPLIENSFFSAYQRYIYHFMFAAIPLSAIGLYYSFKWLKNKTNNINKILKYTLLIFFICFIILSSMYQYHTFKSETKLYKVIEEKEINSLEALSKYPKGKVLTPLDMGIAIKPITKIHEPALTFFDWEKTSNLTHFHKTSCEQKEEIIYNEELLSDNYYFHKREKNRENIKYVISEEEINCLFLEKIPIESKYYIYRTILNNETMIKISHFQEDQDFIKVPSSKVYDNFTLITWVKPNTPTSGIMKSYYGDGYNTGWMIYTDNNLLRLNWADEKGKRHINSTKKLSNDNLYFISLTYNGNFTLYLNGEKQDSKKANIKYEEKNLGLAKSRIGSIFDKPAPKEIINLRVINKYLNESEIETTYKKEALYIN